jgi:hypothetical protein
MIPKSGYRFSEKIKLKQKSWSVMTVRRSVISLQRRLTGRRAAYATCS